MPGFWSCVIFMDPFKAKPLCYLTLQKSSSSHWCSGSSVWNHYPQTFSILELNAACPLKFESWVYFMLLKFPPRADMMWAVSRIEFASELLGLLVSGRVTSCWWKYDYASHPSNVAFTHTVSALHRDIVPLIKLNWLRVGTATITAVWRMDTGCGGWGGCIKMERHNVNSPRFDLWESLADRVADQTCAEPFLHIYGI